MYFINSRLPFKIFTKIKARFLTTDYPFSFNKILVLNKISRLEIEKLSNPKLTDEELQKSIIQRGIDYECMLKQHTLNKNFQNKVVTILRNLNIKVKEVNRFDCTDEDIEWCDAVFSIGGDGTFLNAARRVHCQSKPVIGFNSDPYNSEGFLCLPKKYSFDVASALKKLIEGNFKWMFRSRIRVTLEGDSQSFTPTELHDVKLFKTYSSKLTKKKRDNSNTPILALNEVFMSEIFAAKVSCFEMKLDNSKKGAKIKSSGLCICTGTGSTSWNLSINRLSNQDVHDILMLYISKTKGKINNNFETIVKNVSDKFNERFKFGPEEQILGYAIRDLISLGVWPQPKGVIEPRGFAKTIELKSKCHDAAIIVDGGISFPFNEGAISCLQIHPKDSLRTVILNE